MHQSPHREALHSSINPLRMHATSPETIEMVDLVLDYSRNRILAETNPLDGPQTPDQLASRAGRAITPQGLGAAEALSLFETVLAPSCITTDDPSYLSFIPVAPTKASIAFDLVVSATALYGGSWLEGSGAVHAENEVLRWLADEFGLPSSAGGVFVQGGTLGNLTALVAARHAAKARLTAAKIAAPTRWKLVCSVEAHASIRSAAAVMDVDVVGVPTENGVLSGSAVRLALEEHGDSVFAVIATAGGTNFGIVDDLASIAALKSEFQFWLHVDGAYGLAGMLSPKTRHLFTGVEQADTVIVDPHKWLFAPFDACALIYRDPEQGRTAHTQHAEYLDTLADGGDWNPSDFGIHLTRRPRGLPMWFSLATYGTDVYRAAITASIDVAEQIAAEIKSRSEFTLVREPQLGIVVFERNGWTFEDYNRWSERLLDDQLGFVVPSSHNGRPNARFAIVNPKTSVALLSGILDTMLQ